MKNIFNNRYVIWAILTIPSIPMLAAIIGDDGTGRHSVFHMLLHPTGEFAARFMIISMVITPIRMIFPQSDFMRWMAKNRRYFGVAAFLYALAHTIFYIVDEGSMSRILGEFWELGILTGWIAMFIFVPLAITSNDFYVRRLGTKWKVLQRWVYVAAVGTLAHWILVSHGPGGAIVHFLPLGLLEGFRVYTNITRKRARAT